MTKIKKTKIKKNGCSLLEVIIALVIFSMGIVGVINITPTSNDAEEQPVSIESKT